MKNFKGTWKLVRLAIRRDRIKLPAIISIIALIMFASLASLSEVYKTTEERITYAASAAPSVIAKFFGGTVDGPSIGSITMVETYLFVGLLIAFMSTMTIIRHTRFNEENGSAELIGSTIVGRYSSISSAVILSFFANIIVGFLVFIILLSSDDVSASGAFLMSASFACLGIAFASIATFIAQLVESSRGANSITAMVIGVAYIIRGVGDSIGGVSDNGLSADSSWVSLLTPFGWGFQVHPFTQQNWIYLIPLLLFAISFLALAYYFMNKRDVGLSIFPSRKGPKSASRKLLGSFGLTWRIQRGVLIGWAVSFAIIGVIYGVMVQEFEDIFKSNEEARQFIEGLGGSGNFNDVFFAAMFGYTAVIAAGYCAQALLKMRSEESTQHLEFIASTKVSRFNWAIKHLAVVIIGIVLLMFLLGVSTAITHVIISGANYSEIYRLGFASLAQLPAILSFVGVVVLLIGSLPRLAVTITWAIFAVMLLMYQLGGVLDLPNWLMNVSPFTHSPVAPSANIEYTPILLLSIIFIFLTSLGLALFQKRDLTFN